MATSRKALSESSLRTARTIRIIVFASSVLGVVVAAVVGIGHQIGTNLSAADIAIAIVSWGTAVLAEIVPLFLYWRRTRSLAAAIVGAVGFAGAFAHMFRNPTDTILKAGELLWLTFMVLALLEWIVLGISFIVDSGRNENARSDSNS